MELPLFVFILCFVITFIIGMPIALGMMMSSIFYCLLAPGPATGLQMVATQFLTQLDVKFVLIAVPLFVFAANVMNSGEVTNRIFSFADAVVGRWRGGLGHVNVVASIIFSGMTGSAIADASGLGLMEIEAMRRHGYSDGFSCAITAASATIGPIFPPSIPMVFYAMLSGASIGKLFIGGMVPGILIGIALMIYIAAIAGKRGFPRGGNYSWNEFLKISLNAIPALLTPVILIGGIYTGIVTPTEAGALAGFYALVISFTFYKALGWAELKKIIIDTATTTGKLTLIVGAAFSFSYIISIEKIPGMFANLLLGITTNKYFLLLIINIIFLVLGMFIDIMAITLVFIPMVLPLINSLGINLIHFGVVVVLNMMIGLSTPPFGMLLFITSGISGTPLLTVIKEIIPMLLVLIVVLLLITYVPEIVLFLPNRMG